MTSITYKELILSLLKHKYTIKRKSSHTQLLITIIFGKKLNLSNLQVEYYQIVTDGANWTLDIISAYQSYPKTHNHHHVFLKVEMLLHINYVIK